MQEFNAVLKANAKHPSAAYVEIPPEVENAFGGKGRVKVKATIDGIPYQGSLVRMGMPFLMLLVKKDIRETLGKTHGDSVHITLVEDTAPRVVEVPPQLKQAFSSAPEAKSFFETLSYTNQKEYVGWITSAKRETTRESRLYKTIEKLLAGKKNPSA